MTVSYSELLGKVANVAWQRNSTEFLESFRPNQIRSKEFLVESILLVQTKFKKAAVLGSWNGILLYELMKDYVDYWHFYDLSPDVVWDRSRYFELSNMTENYASITGDAVQMFNNTGLAKEYDLIINPSCEHMEDIRAESGPLYALTSNNYTEVKEHINTIEHEEDLAIKNNINDIRFKGKIQIQKPVPYERYCVIGYA